MRTTKVLVSHHMVTDADLAKIAAAGPGVEAVRAAFVDDVTRGVIASGSGARVDDGSHFARHAADAEVILCFRLPDDIVAIAPNLRWVQVLGAGVDYLAPTRLLEHGITLTSSSGLNAPPIAEFVLMYMLMHVKQMPKRFEAQRERRWTRYPNDELRDATLGIVGPGNIGSEVAKRAAAFGMRVVAARRSYTPGMTLPHVDELYPLARLHEMLGTCDYVVVSVSLTRETRHLIGAAEFAAMKPGAFFINVARGPVVDEAALLEALRNGHLGGAGLDVFDEEPLPETSPLWHMPGVIITPHNSGGVRAHGARATEFFCENLRRYLAGEPLVNVIDPRDGY
jgi:phosphoglycerate dehydrogenase-like enzyme